jgi:hypothetical protein
MATSNKLLAARALAERLQLPIPPSRTALYAALREEGYVWDTETGWTADVTVRVRLEGAPHEVLSILTWLRSQNDVAVVGKSRLYSNRTGTGVRAYLTVSLTDLLPFADEDEA